MFRSWNKKMRVILLVCYLSAAFSWVKEMENPKLYQGDIVLTNYQLLQLKSGASDALLAASKRWPNGVVPYTIDQSLVQFKQAVKSIIDAISEYHKYTCLVFKERDNETGYIEFYYGNGCSSSVGYKSRKQSVSLSRGCWLKAIVMHEIGHALGLYHEQSRPDRDHFVTIVPSNIRKEFYHNFDKISLSCMNTYNTSYDYLSMMHYSWNAFAINESLPTIITNNDTYQYHIGQDTGFSMTDVEEINTIYNCTGPFPTPPEYTIVPGCFNLGSGCTGQALDGDCNNSVWQSDMYKFCRRACGFCEDSVIQNTANVYIPTKSSSGNCHDLSLNCKSIVEYCQTFADIFKIHCNKTCNLCDAGNASTVSNFSKNTSKNVTLTTSNGVFLTLKNSSIEKIHLHAFLFEKTTQSTTQGTGANSHDPV